MTIMRSLLNVFKCGLYKLFRDFTTWKYRSIYGMDIGEGTLISRKASLDVVNPKSIHIGKYTSLASAVLLTHDACRQMKADIFIGDNCFLGMRSIILPGIKIGNEVIVGAGSVVTKDVPSNCIVAGNPAKIIKEGITCGKLGRLISSNE